MKKTIGKNVVTLISTMILVFALAVPMTGCNKKETVVEGAQTVHETGETLGEGKTSFQLTIVDVEGNETVLTINTDETTVGAALMALDVIAGEVGDYGLYIETVNGKTLDFNKDGKYWAFYINGEYAMSGVDTTPIAEGEAYELRAE